MNNSSTTNQKANASSGLKNLIHNILVSRGKDDREQTQNSISKWNKLKKQGIQTIDKTVLKTMVREGIPDLLRKDMWPLFINERVPQYSNILGQSLNQKITKMIDFDVERTLKSNIMFSQNESCSRGLRRVLSAICSALPQIGYYQGLNFLVAILLLRLPEQDAFKQTFYILHGLGHENLFNINNIQTNLFVFDRLIQKHFKQFYKHLHKYQINSSQYALNWFMNIFCEYLPLQITLQIIELYLSEGKKILFRAALTIIKYKKHKAKSLNSFEDILMYLKNSDNFQLIPTSEFIKEMFSFNISRKELNTLQTTYTNKH